MPKSAKRKERRQEQKASYLSYKHRSALNVGLDEDGRANRQPEIRPDSGYMCAKCRLILSRYEGIYKSLIHQRSELNKRKHANPRPKRPDFAHYRGLEKIFLIPWETVLLFMHPSFTQNIKTKDCSSKGNKTTGVTGTTQRCGQS